MLIHSNINMHQGRSVSCGNLEVHADCIVILLELATLYIE